MTLNVRNVSKLGVVLTIVAMFASGCAMKSATSPGDSADIDTENSIVSDDMILDTHEMKPAGVQEGAKGFTAYSSVPWTGGVIPVLFDSTVSSTRRSKFFAQCAIWSTYAKVKCITRTTQAKYLLVTAKDTTNCYTHLGMGSTTAIRVFNFGMNWCWDYDWAILHDIGHVMGLMHEHQRSDRDAYIQMLPSNILPAFAFAFDILTTSQNVTPYDFRSIMQYPSYSYAISGKKSIVARPAYASQQQYLDVQPKVLSKGDKITIQKIYGSLL